MFRIKNTFYRSAGTLISSIFLNPSEYKEQNYYTEEEVNNHNTQNNAWHLINSRYYSIFLFTNISCFILYPFHSEFSPSSES